MKPAPLLWFAWKIVPLRYTKQLNSENWLLMLCCDLLEKSYLCGIQNNRYGFLLRKSVVVICLKNRTFAVYKTTWIFVNKSGQSVVICLKNRTFAVYKTTTQVWRSRARRLWFAWKIVPLRYTKQPWEVESNADSLVVICLKNRTFAVYKTTGVIDSLKLTAVVICLKNRTFAVYKTTKVVIIVTTSFVVICLKNRTFAVYKTTWILASFCLPRVVICLKNRTFAVYKTTVSWFYLLSLSSCDLLEKSYLCGIQNNPTRTVISTCTGCDLLEK